MKFNSDLKTEALFFTDSNGREMLERRRDYRPTWRLNQTENVAGNYYPVNSRIYVRDFSARKQLTLVTDRSQGGSSIQDGSLELMLHRRILNDDSLGVSEPLNELGVDGKGLVVKGTTNVIFDTIVNSGRLHRELALAVNNKPVLIFDPDIRAEKLLRKERRLASAVSGELPEQLHLLTLMQEDGEVRGTSCIVRIEHIYEVNEDPELSKPVTIDLRDYLSPLIGEVTGIVEQALGANIPVTELEKRLDWNKNSKVAKATKEQKLQDYKFEFEPMQIRTFRVYYQ